MKKRMNNHRLAFPARALTAALVAAMLCAGCAQTPASNSSDAASTDTRSTQTAQVSQPAEQPVQASSETADENPSAGDTASVETESTGNTANAETGSSSSESVIRAEDEVAFDSQKYAEQMKNAEVIEASSQYRYPASTLEEIVQNSTELVACEVEEVEFVTILNGQPQTKTVVKILDSLKGGLEPGDRITVYNDGGYITMDDYIKTREIEARFPDATQQQRMNTVYEIKNSDAQNERYPEVGDRYFYGLRTDSSLNGGYFPTTGPFTTYRMDDSGRYTRRPDTKALAGETPSGNSVESFTLDWLREQLAEMENA